MSLPDISTLLPQQASMRLLDAVIDYNTTQLWAEVTPLSSSIFAGTTGVHACIGLEYLAQASAAFFTLQATEAQSPQLNANPKAEPKAKPKEGMLIASRRFTTKMAIYPFAQRLLLRVRLTSALPPNTAGRGLVKFQGEIFIPSSTLPPLPGPAQLAELALADAVTMADLSVYL